MARGTDFGGIHSHYHLHLIQQSVEIDPAEPKLKFVDIPGADGVKDMSTQPAGRVTFNARKLTWTFAIYPGERWDDKHRQVSNALNGRQCMITLDSDPDYYYIGRLSVSKYKVDNVLRQITVVATCQPYKLKQEPTVAVMALSGDFRPMTLQNERKAVAPVIQVTTEAILRWNGATINIPAGTHEILGITLEEGVNVLEAMSTGGVGTITVTYQEGAL